MRCVHFTQQLLSSVAHFHVAYNRPRRKKASAQFYCVNKCQKWIWWKTATNNSVLNQYINTRSTDEEAHATTTKISFLLISIIRQMPFIHYINISIHNRIIQATNPFGCAVVCCHLLLLLSIFLHFDTFNA